MTYRTPFQLFLGIILASAVTANAQLVGDLVTAEVSASRDKVYVNEQFQLILSITSLGVSLDQNFQLLSMPDKNKIIFSEFKELPGERNLQGNQIRDKRRFVCDARALTPETLGVAPYIKLGIVSGFGPFRQISYNTIKAKELALPVLPLPEGGKPKSFSGAIGQFTLQTEVSPSDVAIGDLITVTTTIKGKGYIEPVSTINIPLAPNFKVYPSKTVPGIESNTRIFEQILVPQSTNATAIPAFSFCYFDPYETAYKTVSSGPFPIIFHAATKAKTETIYRPVQTKAPTAPRLGLNIIQNNQYTNNHSSGMRIAAVAAYWTVIISLSLLITKKYRRGSIAAFGILVVAAMIFLPLWNLLQASAKEAIAVRSDKARLAPAYSALVIFEVSRGSATRIVDAYGTWVKIEMSGKKGWIPADALTNSAPINAVTN